MIVDIFSTFDPAINSILGSSPLFLFILIISILSLFSSTWLSPSPLLVILNPISSFISQQIFRSKMNNLSSLTWFLTPMFSILILTNIMGLTPYFFSFSSHLIFTLSLGLPLWLMLIMTSLFYSPTSFSASLLPSGAPLWLAPALVLIESISISVRPITLSFRLAANMSAGHIVLGLINMYLTGALNSTLLSFSSLLLISTGYTLFEVGICLVQAYIFCLLLTLYADEHTD